MITFHFWSVQSITIVLKNLYSITIDDYNYPISAQVFLETKLPSESLGPLIDFLAYLDPKLWLKNQKLGNNSSSTKGNLGHFG